MAELTDHEIITGCINGDRRVRGLFVHRFSNLVYVSIQGVFKARHKPMVREDIDDLHNSIFLSLFEKNCKKLSQYEGRNGCSLASWVRMIAVRLVLDYFRKQAHAVVCQCDPEVLDFLNDHTPDDTSPLDQLETSERMGRMEDALATLLPRDRLVIRLHCFEERPLDQVARIMDLNPNTLYSLKSRAIQRLKRAMGEDLEN